MSRKKSKANRNGTYAIGTEHNVNVEALDGHPAARARDMHGHLFRVPRAVPGDSLTVTVVAKGRKELWAEITSIHEQGLDRVDPPCPVVTDCGGCPWQPISYQHQLEAKARMMSEAIAPHPELAGAHIVAPEGITPEFGYRTKIQMPFGGIAGHLTTGFYAPRTHDLISVEKCVVQHPLGEAVRTGVLDVLNRHHIEPYNEGLQSGDLRYLLVRVAPLTKQVGVVLVVRSLDAYDWPVMAAELESIPGLSGIWVNENSTSGNAVLGKRTVHLAGVRRLKDTIKGIDFHRNPLSFFQTNHRATEQLVDAVRKCMTGTINTVFDLYCGGGLFAVTLADLAKQLYLVESNADAVAAARASLRESEINHAEIILGRTETVVSQLVTDGIAADAIVIDPPRSGIAPEAIGPIFDCGAERIVYVSCNLRSLIRDLRAFSQLGMRLERMYGVDMFPHTPHLETVSLLVR